MLDNNELNINLPDNLINNSNTAIKQLSRTASIILGSINTLLIPMEITSALAEHKAKEFIEKITKTASKIPPERLTNPPISIIGPAFEGAKYSFTEDDLRDMYANLIAKSLDKAEEGKQFLSFINIIQQLSPAEARLFKALFTENSFMSYPIATIKFTKGTGYIVAMDCLSSYQFEELTEKQIANMLLNFSRLGLIEIDKTTSISSDLNAYSFVEKSESMKEIKKQAAISGYDVSFDKILFRMSLFGKSFFLTCITDEIAQSLF